MITCDKCGLKGRSSEVETYKVAMIPAGEDVENHLEEFVVSETQLCHDCCKEVEGMIQDVLDTLKPKPPVARKAKKSKDS